MSEVWKTIPGFEGLYQASTEGRIRSVDREVHDYKGKPRKLKGRILKHGVSIHGYYQVSLSLNGKPVKRSVHQLIALTFIGERPEGYDTCHLNGDCKDNTLKNLTYDTKYQNSLDRIRNGDFLTNSNFTVEDIVRIRHLHNVEGYYQKDIAKMYGVSRHTILRIINRQSFSYVKDNGTIQNSDTAVS